MKTKDQFVVKTKVFVSSFVSAQVSAGAVICHGAAAKDEA